jgi:hypothetical protein
MKNIIIAAVVEALAFLVGKNEQQLETLGTEHGKWLQANATDKIPAGETIESTAQKFVKPYLRGLNAGLDLVD